MPKFAYFGRGNKNDFVILSNRDWETFAANQGYRLCRQGDCVVFVDSKHEYNIHQIGRAISEQRPRPGMFFVRRVECAIDTNLSQ